MATHRCASHQTEDAHARTCNAVQVARATAAADGAPHVPRQAITTTAAIAAIALAMMATPLSPEIVPGVPGPGADRLAYAQEQGLDMDLEVSDGEKTAIFAGFAIAVIGVFVFLARDIILRRKTEYDSKEYESKKEKTYEKYHSDWTDDYEEIGTRRGPKRPADESLGALREDGSMPNYYETLGVGHDATSSEIKESFRRLAKEMHPDRVRQGRSDPKRGAAGGAAGGSIGQSDDNDVYSNMEKDKPDNPTKTMAEINEAYRVLSDKDLRKKYDEYMSS